MQSIKPLDGKQSNFPHARVCVINCSHGEERGAHLSPDEIHFPLNGWAIGNIAAHSWQNMALSSIKLHRSRDVARIHSQVVAVAAALPTFFALVSSRTMQQQPEIQSRNHPFWRAGANQYIRGASEQNRLPLSRWCLTESVNYSILHICCGIRPWRIRNLDHHIDWRACGAQIRWFLQMVMRAEAAFSYHTSCLLSLMRKEYGAAEAFSKHVRSHTIFFIVEYHVAFGNS
jgi:hypothetical protein